jgi:hypothetical protein
MAFNLAHTVRCDADASRLTGSATGNSRSRYAASAICFPKTARAATSQTPAIPPQPNPRIARLGNVVSQSNLTASSVREVHR